MQSTVLEILQRILKKSPVQVKRWIIWNLVIEPVTAVLYIPYNLFIIGYSDHQFIRWALTGAEYALIVNFVIQIVATFVVRFMDKYYPDNTKMPFNANEKPDTESEV